MGREHGRGTIGSQWIGCTRRPKAKSVVVTVEGVQRSCKPFEKHFAKKEPDGHQRRLRGDSKGAIPKREDGTGADHGPSSPVPQRTRNALRLRFVPGR